MVEFSGRIRLICLFIWQFSEKVAGDASELQETLQQHENDQMHHQGDLVLITPQLIVVDEDI